MRYTRPDVPRPFRTPLVPLVPILGMLANLTLMVALGWHNWARLFVWLAIGLVIYAVLRLPPQPLRAGTRRSLSTSRAASAHSCS